MALACYRVVNGGSQNRQYYYCKECRGYHLKRINNDLQDNK